MILTLYLIIRYEITYESLGCSVMLASQCVGRTERYTFLAREMDSSCPYTQ
jgi:hypothetical protein